MKNEMKPKISFGIIVLNGEPFTKYNISALYPHAYQIIIVEGACYGAINIATTDGHSIDGTLEILRKIKEHDDPENKITIVTAEDEGYPDGFWPGEKYEQSQNYAKRATGDYLWQVDIDEFYKDEDIAYIINLLEKDPEISAVSFIQQQFWGGVDYLVDSWLLRRGLKVFHRLFKWGPGYQYVNHRPPTVINENGADTRTIKWLNAKQTKKMGLFLYHYSFVFPKQVYEKASYYKNAEWAQRKKADWWANEVFMKLTDPFSVFSVYWDVSWLKKFRGEHPHQINVMMDDIKSGKLVIETRRQDDLEKLLKNPFYKIKVVFYILLNPFEKVYKMIRNYIKRNFYLIDACRSSKHK